MKANIRFPLGIFLFLAGVAVCAWAGRHISKFEIASALGIALAFVGGIVLILPRPQPRLILSSLGGLAMMAFLVYAAGQIVDGLIPSLSAVFKLPRYELIIATILFCVCGMIGGWTACTFSKSEGPEGAQIMIFPVLAFCVGAALGFWTPRLAPNYLCVGFVILVPIATRIGALARELTSAVASPDE